MVTEQERKLIYRYCILPVLAKAFLAVALLISPLWGLLVMIGDLAFHDGFTMTGLVLCMVIAFGYTAAFVICYVMSRRATKDERWMQLTERVAASLSERDFSPYIKMAMGTKAAGTLLHISDNKTLDAAGNILDAAAAIGTISAVTQMTEEASQNARLVAGLAGVKVPSARKYVLPVVLLPMILLIAVHIPQFISAKEKMDSEIEIASKAVYTLQSSFEKGCGYVYVEDPKEGYEEYGYTVSGYLVDVGGDDNSHLSVLLGNDGRIHEAAYFIDVDIQATKEENIQHAQQAVEKLNKMMADSGVEASSEVILTQYTWPEEFLTAFRNGSYYENIRMPVNDYMNVSYDTDPEEEYDEYSSSYLYLSIESEID